MLSKLKHFLHASIYKIETFQYVAVSVIIIEATNSLTNRHLSKASAHFAPSVTAHFAPREAFWRQLDPLLSPGEWEAIESRSTLRMQMGIVMAVCV